MRRDSPSSSSAFICAHLRIQLPIFFLLRSQVSSLNLSPITTHLRALCDLRGKTLLLNPEP